MDYAARPCTYVTGRASRFCYYFEPERAACLKLKVVCGCRVQPQTGIRDRAARRRRPVYNAERWGGTRGRSKGLCYPQENWNSLWTVPPFGWQLWKQFCSIYSVCGSDYSCVSQLQAGGRRWARRLGRSVQLNVLFFVCRSASVLELLSKEKCCLFECAN